MNERFKLLIKGWRVAWGQGDFPVYFGQLSSTSGTPTPDNASHVAVVREGRRMALALPNTAMSVRFSRRSPIRRQDNQGFRRNSGAWPHVADGRIQSAAAG